MAKQVQITKDPENDRLKLDITETKTRTEYLSLKDLNDELTNAQNNKTHIQAKMQSQLDDIDAKIAEVQTQIQWYNDNIGG